MYLGFWIDKLPKKLWRIQCAWREETKTGGLVPAGVQKKAPGKRIIKIFTKI